MNLTEHYNKLWSKFSEDFKKGKYVYDPLIGKGTDKRFGIILTIRPSEKVKCEIQKLLLELKKAGPNQYYYPASDIHITLLPVIACHEGFDLSSINIGAYVKTIHQSLASFKSFSIELRGLTASPSCILIQGFYKNDILIKMRETLYKNFSHSTLEYRMGEWPYSPTAHSTVVRFRKAIHNTMTYFKILDEYRNFDFGAFYVKEVELVYSDWYHKNEVTKKFYTFNLERL